MICMALGGRAAEDIMLGKVTTGEWVGKTGLWP